MNNHILVTTLLSLFLFSHTSPVVGQTVEESTAAPQNEPHAADRFVGKWNAHLISPGGELPFGLEIVKAGSERKKLSGFITNGPERIDLPNVVVTDKGLLRISITHYDSTLTLRPSPENPRILVGDWKKRKGVDLWTQMKVAVDKTSDSRISKSEILRKYEGRYAVTFKSEPDEPAVAVFRLSKSKDRIVGTFLTTTGDFRYLDGVIDNDGQLKLSCFDGAHAFLFKAVLNPGTNLRAEMQKGATALTGDFWSSDSYHDKWSAVLDPDAKLPDAFAETTLIANKNMGEYSFPDLDGKLTSLNDPKFAGKARIIYVFGSWCPNCHDAGKYLSELNAKYKDKGLSILGLAFEHTGNAKRDGEQVRRYLKRNGANYPVLVAGLSSKKKASESLPFLDRVRSYPTTIFVDSNGQVRAIHTGFTGPATGDAYTQLRKQFEAHIEAMLGEK